MISLLSKILFAMMLVSQIGKTTQQLAPFCVTRSFNTDGPSPVIDFDNECFVSEEPSGFDLTTDTFSPPYSGLYWLHFTAGLPDTGDLTDVQLALPTRTINIPRSAGGLVSVSSRSDIVDLTAGVDRLHLTSAATLFSEVSDVQVSWSGFHLDSTMTEVAAFSVAMSPGEFSNRYSNIPFDIVFVDTYSGWNLDRYIIPVDGLWVISLHVGDPPQQNGTDARINLTPTEYSGFGVMSRYPSGVDMCSVTVVVKVNSGVEVAAELRSSYIYSDANYQTAMSGFLYSPTTQPAVAWTVVLSYGASQYGPKDPVQFGTVLVNEGNGYNVNTSRFIAPHGGLYYVTIAGSAYEGDMKMDLLLNGFTKAAVYYHKKDFYNYMSRSRAIILRLNEGDELRVRIPAGYLITAWANEEEFTVFAGFRIL